MFSGGGRALCRPSSPAADAKPTGRLRMRQRLCRRRWTNGWGQVNRWSRTSDGDVRGAHLAVGDGLAPTLLGVIAHYPSYGLKSSGAPNGTLSLLNDACSSTALGMNTLYSTHE